MEHLLQTLFTFVLQSAITVTAVSVLLNSRLERQKFDLNLLLGRRARFDERSFNAIVELWAEYITYMWETIRLRTIVEFVLKTELGNSSATIREGSDQFSKAQTVGSEASELLRNSDIFLPTHLVDGFTKLDDLLRETVGALGTGLVARLGHSALQQADEWPEAAREAVQQFAGRVDEANAKMVAGAEYYENARLTFLELKPSVRQYLRELEEPLEDLAAPKLLRVWQKKDRESVSAAGKLARMSERNVAPNPDS